MSRTRPTATRRLTPRARLLSLAVLIGVAGNLAAQPLAAFSGDRIVGYTAFLSGARLVRQNGCLYCPAATVQQILLETGHGGGHTAIQGSMEYLNPPFVAVALQPLTAVSFDTGLAIFLGISMLALLAAMVLVWDWCPPSWPPPLRAAVIVSAFGAPVAASAVLDAQFDPLALLATVMAVRLLRPHPWFAGGVLALCLVKPQLVWLVPPLLLLAGSWRAVGGMLVAVVLEALVGVAGAGWGSPAAWIRSSLAPESAEGSASMPSVLSGITGNHVSPLVFVAVLCCLAGAIGWRCRETLRAEPALAIALGIVASLVASPHLWDGDTMMLGVPLLLLLRQRLPSLAICMAGLSLAYLLDGLVAAANPPGVVLAMLAVSVWCVVVLVADMQLLRRTPVMGEPLHPRVVTAPG